MSELKLTDGDPLFVAPDLSLFSKSIGMFVFWIRCDEQIIALHQHINGVFKEYYQLGDFGKSHWYELDDGKVVYSDNVWFRFKPGDAIVHKAKEITEPPPSQEVYEPGDGRLMMREEKAQFDKNERDQFNNQLEQYTQLLSKVRFWRDETCHPSVITFREGMIKHLSYENQKKLQLCYCGIITVQRQVQNERSINKGQIWIGCANFPQGCRYFQYASPESARRQKLMNRFKNESKRFEQKHAKELAELMGYKGRSVIQAIERVRNCRFYDDQREVIWDS
jgi:hypothetical protein